MKQSFKFRVYPTRDQERWLYAELKHQKRLYNYMLQMRSQMYQYGSISVSQSDQQAHLTKLRENSHYGNHAQDMQVETLKRVDAAYGHFFRRCKDPKEVTLKKTARGWYAFIVSETSDTLPCIPKSACGVDVGTKKFVITSEGDKIGNRRFYKRGQTLPRR